MVTYNKQGKVKKGDRLLSYGGPRDSQRKLAAHNNIKDLLALKDDLISITTSMSAKNVVYPQDKSSNNTTAVNREVIELETKYNIELSELRKKLYDKKEIVSDLMNKITKLEAKIDTRDETILKLSNKLIMSSTLQTEHNVDDGTVDANRPSIDRIIIDPTVKGVEDKYESHIKTIDKVSTKHSVRSDVSKLKELMGNKLPKI